MPALPPWHSLPRATTSNWRSRWRSPLTVPPPGRPWPAWWVHSSKSRSSSRLSMSRWRFAHDCAPRLPNPLECLVMAAKPSVLFVCVHNAGRYQIAAALLMHLSRDRIEVRSAGTEPAEQINPVAIAAMAELGIDITAARPKILTGDAVRSSDVVITMGCGAPCPSPPGVSYRDWTLDDPAGQPLEAVRAIRDEIAERVQALIIELAPTATTA